MAKTPGDAGINVSALLAKQKKNEHRIADRARQFHPCSLLYRDSKLIIASLASIKVLKAKKRFLWRDDGQRAFNFPPNPPPNRKAAKQPSPPETTVRPPLSATSYLPQIDARLLFALYKLLSFKGLRFAYFPLLSLWLKILNCRPLEAFAGPKRRPLSAKEKSRLLKRLPLASMARHHVKAGAKS